MAIHKPYDRYLVSTGAVKTEGGSVNLAYGQLGIFKVDTKHNKQGLEALSIFKNLPKKQKVEIQVGNNTAYKSSTFPFEIGKIRNLRVSAPQKTEQTVDEVIIGYNGIDDKTAMDFKVGEVKNINFRFYGEKVGQIGYPQAFVDLTLPLDSNRCSYYYRDQKCNPCNECGEVEALPVLLAGLQRFLNTPLKGGVKVTDLADFTVIKKCTGGVTPNKVKFDFYELSILDSGTLEALSAVQSQYPSVKVVRKCRKENVTTYQFVQKEASPAPAKFKRGINSFIKGCKDCESPVWKAVQGGFLYTVSLTEDNAETDIKAIDDTAKVGVVQESVVKGGVTTEGLFTYTFISYKELKKEKLDAFIESKKDKSVVVSLIGTVASVCKNETVSEFDWKKVGTCDAIEQTYVIDLPDTKCGQDRLDELKARFGEEVKKADPEVKGGCQTRYEMNVLSNIVCPDECSDEIFAGLYSTEAPQTYDGRTWVLKDELNLGTKCKVGLRIKGKPFAIHPSENFREELGFTESSVGVMVSGGYSNDIPEMAFDNRQTPFHVEYVTRQAPRTHVGGNMWQYERMGRTFFTGSEEHTDNISKLLLGEQSLFPAGAQLLDYVIEVERETFSQSFAQKYNESIEYHILVQIGKHKEIEKLLNLLVSANGIDPVRALAE